MEELNIDIKNKIIDYLKDKPSGASILQIANAIDHNRITVTKYLEIMNASGLVTYEVIAQAKMWKLHSDYGKSKILIIEDEKYVANLIKISFMDQYRTDFASNGLEGLEKAKILLPDTIILDLMMPEMDGFEVCKKLKENPLTSGIPIMILSAKSQINDKREALKLGADDYMTKPFDPLELEARVKNMLRRVKDEYDTNFVTGLPGINKTNKELTRIERKNVSILLLKLENMKEYDSKVGIKKGNDILGLISKSILENIKNYSPVFLGHISRSNFVLVINKDHADHIALKLKDNFDRLIPYLYSDIEINNLQNGLSLQVVSLPNDISTIDLKNG